MYECLVPESQQEASEKVWPIQFPEEFIQLQTKNRDVSYNLQTQLTINIVYSLKHNYLNITKVKI